MAVQLGVPMAELAGYGQRAHPARSTCMRIPQELAAADRPAEAHVVEDGVPAEARAGESADAIEAGRDEPRPSAECRLDEPHRFGELRSLESHVCGGPGPLELRQLAAVAFVVGWLSVLVAAVHIAVRTGEGWSVPWWRTDPVDAAMSSGRALLSQGQHGAIWGACTARLSTVQAIAVRAVGWSRGG